MTRTVTICIPPREDDPEGEAYWFCATVADGEVVATKRIRAPKPMVRKAQ